MKSYFVDEKNWLNIYLYLRCQLLGTVSLQAPECLLLLGRHSLPQTPLVYVACSKLLQPLVPGR